MYFADYCDVTFNNSPSFLCHFRRLQNAMSLECRFWSLWRCFFFHLPTTIFEWKKSVKSILWAWTTRSLCRHRQHHNFLVIDKWNLSISKWMVKIVESKVKWEMWYILVDGEPINFTFHFFFFLSLDQLLKSLFPAALFFLRFSFNSFERFYGNALEDFCLQTLCEILETGSF